MQRRVFLAAALAFLPNVLPAQAPPNREVILATTTSLYDTGLLDTLAPRFERATGYHLRVVAVGSGQALHMGERGDADVILAHSPRAESDFMAAGHGTRRRVVAFNYFTIVGPREDPVDVRGAASAVEALQRIARSRQVFVSRGDSSGTHVRELLLWTEGGGRPPWPGYLETGQGMSPSLLVANERRGYTLTDRSTFGTLQRHLDLVSLREIDPSLRNVYHVIEVNPLGKARVNAAGGTAFADFVVSQEVQDLMATFGTSLFTPARGVEPR